MYDFDTTDVVICGCGPTGALLSANLSRLGVRHIILEREPDITTDPRGIALDEDGIRSLQAVGIYEKIFTDIGQSEYCSTSFSAVRSRAGPQTEANICLQ
jgi:2-polyprenyl-6-methoxyphenol hydroxylase-like FAD-dependent oxidoreductase